MYVVIIILVIMLIISIFYNYASIKNGNSLIEQVEYIIENETNVELISEFAGVKNKQLIQKLNELIKELRRNRQRVTETDENLKQTIANVTHDLRTPLTVISGYVQMLSDNKVDQVEQKEMLKKVTYNIIQLQMQLEALFEYSKLQEREQVLDLQKIDVSELTGQILFSLYTSFVTADIEMEVEITEKLQIITDEGLMRRILQNLFGNMLIHGTTQGSVKLLEVNNEVQLIVGNKMKNDTVEVEKIFDRFYTEDFSRHNKNTGLGLYVVKHCTEILGGKINAAITNNWFEIELIFPLRSE